MRKEGRQISVAAKVAVGIAAVGIGLLVALLAGYFLGRSTTPTKTTTVSFAPAPSGTPEVPPAESEPPELGEEEAGEVTAVAPEEEAGKEEAGEKEAGEKESGEEEASGAALAAGKSTFESTCAGCHTLSEAGASGAVGPNLDELMPSKDLVEHQVTNGGGGMPAFGGTLSGAEIEAVAEYVSTVAGTGNSSAG